MKANKLKKIILNSKFKNLINKVSIKHSGCWDEINITINNERQIKNHRENFNYMNKTPALRCICSFCQKWRKLEEKIYIFVEKIPGINQKQIISITNTHRITIEKGFTY